MPKLYAHQQLALSRMIEKSMLLAADPGCGKTPVGLMLAQHFKAHPQRSGKTLVVAPLSLLEAAWVADAATFTPGLRIASLWASTPQRRAKVLRDAADSDVYVVNPEGFKRIMQWLQAKKPDVLIIDESSMLANPRAQITKAVLKFAYDIPRVYTLSGTPMPNSPLDIWAQVHICNHNLLPPNYYQFRARYGYATGYMNYEWRVSPESRDRLMQDIAPAAMFIAKKDCLDLPAQTYVTRRVYMSSAQRDAYDTMVRDKILPLIDGKSAIASNVLAEIMKLRQITSGWLYDDQHQVYSFADTKAQVLDEVLAELGDRQAIIWVQFIHDADELTKRLNADHVQAAKVIGGTSPTELNNILGAFRSGQYKYLVAHPKTIGHGVTLVNCSYAIFYSLSYSWQEWFQACCRIHRIGQHSPVEYISLVAHKSIDEVIYRAVQRKDNMAKAALEFLREEM